MTKNILNKKALTVRFEGQTYRGIKADGGKASELAKIYDANNSFEKANTHTFRVQKDLFGGQARELIECLNITKEYRKRLQALTVGEIGDNQKILPYSLFAKYKKIFNEGQLKFTEKRDRFLAKYDQYKANAIETLNGAVSEGDFKSTSNVKNRFVFNFLPMPIADSTSLNGMLGDSEQEVIDAVKAEEKKKLEGITSGLFERLHGIIKKLSEGSQYRANSFSEFNDLVDILEDLNIAGSHSLSTLIADLKKIRKDTGNFHGEVSKDERTALKGKFDTALKDTEKAMKKAPYEKPEPKVPANKKPSASSQRELHSEVDDQLENIYL